MFTTRVSLRHATMFTYSHATTPLGQSERVYYLSYFIMLTLVSVNHSSSNSGLGASLQNVQNKMAAQCHRPSKHITRMLSQRNDQQGLHEKHEMPKKIRLILVQRDENK